MTEVGDYFDTPLRRERMQLLVHLVANAEATPYLRAPAGASKTRFLTELGKRLVTEYQVVPLVAGGAFALRDQLAEALGLDAVDAGWPAVVTDRQDDRPLLLLVDDAQALGLGDIADLLDLASVGVHLLLAGSGELAQSASDWEIQFVDLPPFSEDETRAFLQERAGTTLEDSVVRALHRAAGGQPGPLLDALDGLSGPAGGATVTARRGRPWPWILGGLAALLLLGLAWIYQERINAWFEPGGESSPGPTASREETRGEAAVLPANRQINDEPPGDGAQARTPAAATAPAAVGGDQAGVPEPVVTAKAPETPAANDAPEAGPAESDPVLDAIIDEAIRAAAQPPGEATAIPQLTASAAEQATPGTRASNGAGEPSKTDPPPTTSPARAEPPRGDDLAAKAAQTTTDTTAPAVQPVVPPPPRPASRAAKPPAAAGGKSKASPAHESRKSPQKGRAWLLAQPPGHWTLQLVGSRERASIDAFLRRHHIAPPYAVFERELDGRPWYSLVAGSYPSRDAAVAARSRLPAAIARGGVWPRTFASIRKQMQGNL